MDKGNRRAIMRRLFKKLVFFAGWLLSPFTWWNDTFVNIPISYLTANLLFYLLHLPFKWLVICSYWFTNILGIIFMAYGGQDIIRTSKNKMRTGMIMAATLVIYSAVIIYLNNKGKLLPLGAYFKK